MDLEQVWHEAIQRCKQQINDPLKKAALDVIELQTSINITCSDLFFICNNDQMCCLAVMAAWSISSGLNNLVK